MSNRRVEVGDPVLVCTLGYHYTGILVAQSALRIELDDVLKYVEVGQSQDMAAGTPVGAHADPILAVSLPAGISTMELIAALPERKQYSG